ncbi:MAG: ParB N-terminal domain-containing protein [Tenericutes bacterium]|nr:ParB N-terminal domain-containing protein [Mycoplasmatota bacterium]
MLVMMKKSKDLVVYDNNPRNNDDAVQAVANSIKEFGFRVPIVITKDNVIIAGHTRLKAAVLLDLEEVPCVIANDLNDEQIKAFRLADNKTAELATWDFSKLEEELSFINIDMLQFGFEELEELLPDNASDDDFDVEDEISEVPFSEPGDVYILGNHRVMCGDSTKSEDVNKLVDSKTIDMIFTDPPYNVDYEGTAGKIKNDKMGDNNFYLFLYNAYKNMYDHLKPGGAIYVCHAATELKNFLLSYLEAGFKYAQQIIWEKNALVLGRQDYHWRHEPILYGWREGAAHFFVDDRTQDTIWNYNKPRKSEEHPTMKPLELVGKAIANSSRRHETILDLFGGSGSTLIAADQLDRKSCLMELDERFVDVIVKRYIRHSESIEDCYLMRNGKTSPLSGFDIFDNLLL